MLGFRRRDFCCGRPLFTRCQEARTTLPQKLYLSSRTKHSRKFTRLGLVRARAAVHVVHEDSHERIYPRRTGVGEGHPKEEGPR